MEKRRAHSRRCELERLEPRRLLTTAHFTIDALQNVHAISRYIYGTDSTLSGGFSNGTLKRAGGNRWTAYNWENNASNAGSDYLFQNDNALGGGSTPGGAVIPTINDAASHNAAALLTIPMNGYVAADTNGGGNVEYHNNTWDPVNQTWVNGTYNPNYLQQRFKQELPAKGSAFTLTPNPSDQYVYEDEFVNWVKTEYPASVTNPNTPIWFDLDNEPDLWSSTHAEVHPAATTYAEMVADTDAYASAIKAVDPSALVLGPVSYGWNGYTSLQNAPDANGRDFLTYYLQQMAAAQQTYGKRLVDALDLHWYPEATGTNGVRIATDSDSSAPTVAARLQAPRSLWDPTYTESSWITQYSTLGPIDLLPREQAKINTYYPGTKISISEYNYGGGGDISGAIAEADVLGIFGVQNVYAAAEWPLSGSEPFIGGAMQMFRNYDGHNSTFGNTSIGATTDDVADSSVYASYDSSNPGVLTLIAINKTASAMTGAINLNHIQAGATASVYQLTSASSTPQAAGTLSIANPNNFNYTMPAYSVSLLKINLLPPSVTTASEQYQTSPNTLSVTFSQDVSASLSGADVTVTPAAGGSALPATYSGFSGNVATFSLPASLPDGNYHVNIPAAGVTDGAGNPLAAPYSFDFFVLAGDANHDRHVDSSDLAIVNANMSLSGRTYAQGDFNYDGVVNGQDLAILNANFAAWLPAQGALSLPTTNGDNAYRLVHESSVFLDAFSGSPAPASATYRIETSAVTSLSLIGGAGNDSLTLDYSAGPLLPAGGINFDGMGGSDSLSIIGASGSHTINVTSNSAAFDSSNITYANLENVTVDPAAGVDSLAISGASVSFPVPTSSSNITSRSLSNLNIGAGAQLILPALFTGGVLDHADRYLATISNLTLPGRLDTGDSDLVLKNTSTGAIAGLLKTGFSAAAYWNGSTGIISSAAAADPSHLTTLGVLQSGADVSVKYTYYGDADLNGSVNGADYTQIDGGFGQHLSGWSSGDFNYDGVVNGSDYSLIDNAFNQIAAKSAAPLASSVAAEGSTTPFGDNLISSPLFSEPATDAWKLYIDTAP